MKAKLLTSRSTDRSGAASINVMNQLVDRLKNIHREKFVPTADICWGIWANDILRQPANLHESLIERGPPTNNIHLFIPVYTSAEVRLNSIQATSQAALDMMNTLEEQVKVQGIAIANAKTVLVSLVEIISDVTNRQEMVMNVVKIYQNQFRATSLMAGALVVETSSSLEIYNQVTNQEDIEHMDWESLNVDIP